MISDSSESVVLSLNTNHVHDSSYHDEAEHSHQHKHDHDDHNEDGHDHFHHDHENEHGIDNVQLRTEVHDYNHAHLEHEPPRISLWHTVRQFVASAWREQRRMCVVVAVAAFFLFIELTLAYASESLALQSAAFRLLCDILALCTFVVSSVFSRKSSSVVFSYGYDRMYTLLWFGNSVLMIFICLFLFEGVVERLLMGAEMVPTGLSVVTIIGIVLNSSMFVLFANQMYYVTTSPRDRVMSICTSSAVANGISLLSAWTSFHEYGAVMDTLCCMAIVILLMAFIIPTFFAAGRILLQTTPSSLKGRLDKCLREASAFDNVLECTKQNFWELSPGVCIGSLHFLTKAGANEQAVLQHVYRCFSQSPPVVAQLTVQIDKTDW